jgi:hypothetical protein
MGKGKQAANLSIRTCLWNCNSHTSISKVSRWDALSWDSRQLRYNSGSIFRRAVLFRTTNRSFLSWKFERDSKKLWREGKVYLALPPPLDVIIILTFSVSETSILNKPVNKLRSLCRSMEEKPWWIKLSAYSSPLQSPSERLLSSNACAKRDSASL